MVLTDQRRREVLIAGGQGYNCECKASPGGTREERIAGAIVRAFEILEVQDKLIVAIEKQKSPEAPAAGKVLCEKCKKNYHDKAYQQCFPCKKNAAVKRSGCGRRACGQRSEKGRTESGVLSNEFSGQRVGT